MEFEQLNEPINQSTQSPPSPRINEIPKNLKDIDLKDIDLDDIPIVKKPTHKELLEIMKLKSKIMRYKEHFPDVLKHYAYKFNDLDKLDIEELKFFISELEIAVSSRQSANLTKLFYFETVRIIERGGKYLNMQLTGLENALRDNNDIHNVLNEISLKYESDNYMAPEIRLGYLTALTVLQLHKLRSTSSEINNFLGKELNKEFTDQFNDL